MHNTNMQLSEQIQLPWPFSQELTFLSCLKETAAFTKHGLSNKAGLSPTAGRDCNKNSKIKDLVLKWSREFHYWMCETQPKHTFVLRWPCAVGRMLISGHQLTCPHMTSTVDWAVKYRGIYPAVYKQCRSKLILLEENFETAGHYSFT